MRKRMHVVPGWLGRMFGQEDAEAAVQAEAPRTPSPSEERRSAPSGPVPRPKLARVLIIDDEPQVAMGIRRLLYRHDVTIAHSGTQALALLREHAFDVVVSDVMMPEPAGLDIYELLAREGSPIVGRFVFVTGGHWGARARDFLSRIPNQRLDKPVDPVALDLAIARVIQGAELESVEAG